MNLKKILAVVLSMTLLVSCLVSGMSLNTSAATPDQETAKTQLTDAWGKMSKTPEVVFENFVENNSGWTDKTSNSTYDSNIGANVYTATADKGLILVTGAYNNPTKWANFNNYDEIYFYYSSPNSDGTFAPDTCTESSQYASNTLGGPTVTLTKTTDSNLVKFDLMTATKNASGYDSANYYATGAEKRAMFRLRFVTVPTNFKISQVFGVKKTVVPDTADKTLGEVIALAKAEDLSTYQNNAAKTEFEAALAKANAAYYSVEANAIAHISNAWLKVKHNREVIFDTFTYKDASSAWQIINSNIDVDDDGTNDVTYKTAEVNGETVTLAEGVGNLSGSKPGFILVNKAYEAEENQNDNVVAMGGPKNEAAMFDIYDYEEAYLYYSTASSVSIGLASTKLNQNFGDNKVDSSVSVNLDSNSEAGTYRKLDIFTKLNAIEGNTAHSSYGYTGTLDRNVNGEKELDTQYDSALCRAHIGGQYSQLNGISYLYGVKKVKFSEEFGDVFKEVPLEDTIEGTLAYAKGLKYEANGDKTLADWMEAYTKYEAALKNNYNAAELVAVVEDVKAANPAVRISGDAIWSKGNECFYDKGNSTLATAYRTFAQYTCPIEDGKPVLNKVVVDGQSYNLVSRSILIARSADGIFGTLDMSTVGDKYVKTTGDNLSAKYWSVADNGDGTATVTYSMLLKDVSQANAESKYHMTRAMIEYTDGAGNTVQVYSKPRKHGKIKDTFDYAYGKNNNLQWFPTENN